MKGWGTVVQYDLGVRVSRAYPASVLLLRNKHHPNYGALSFDEIAFDLLDYGVPVDIVDTPGWLELAKHLERLLDETSNGRGRLQP